MNWTLAYDENLAFADSPVSISHSFTSNLVIVRAASVAAQPSWKRAGKIYQLFNAPGVGPTEGEYEKAILGTKLIEFPPIEVPFELGFIFVPWLPSLHLQIWKPQV